MASPRPPPPLPRPPPPPPPPPRPSPPPPPAPPPPPVAAAPANSKVIMLGVAAVVVGGVVLIVGLAAVLYWLLRKDGKGKKAAHLAHQKSRRASYLQPDPETGLPPHLISDTGAPPPDAHGGANDGSLRLQGLGELPSSRPTTSSGQGPARPSSARAANGKRAARDERAAADDAAEGGRSSRVSPAALRLLGDESLLARQASLAGDELLPRSNSWAIPVQRVSSASLAIGGPASAEPRTSGSGAAGAKASIGSDRRWTATVVAGGSSRRWRPSRFGQAAAGSSTGGGGHVADVDDLSGGLARQRSKTASGIMAADVVSVAEARPSYGALGAAPARPSRLVQVSGNDSRSIEDEIQEVDELGLGPFAEDGGSMDPIAPAGVVASYLTPLEAAALAGAAAGGSDSDPVGAGEGDGKKGGKKKKGGKLGKKKSKKGLKAGEGGGDEEAAAAGEDDGAKKKKGGKLAKMKSKKGLKAGAGGGEEGVHVHDNPTYKPAYMMPTAATAAHSGLDLHRELSKYEKRPSRFGASQPTPSDSGAGPSDPARASSKRASVTHSGYYASAPSAAADAAAGPPVSRLRSSVDPPRPSLAGHLVSASAGSASGRRLTATGRGSGHGGELQHWASMDGVVATERSLPGSPRRASLVIPDSAFAAMQDKYAAGMRDGGGGS